MADLVHHHQLHHHIRLLHRHGRRSLRERRSQHDLLNLLHVRRKHLLLRLVPVKGDQNGQDGDIREHFLPFRDLLPDRCARLDVTADAARVSFERLHLPVDRSEDHDGHVWTAILH